MTVNRSVPTSVMLAHLSYADVGAAADWLCRAFGFVEHYRYGDPERPAGAQLHLGDAWVMVSDGGDGPGGTVLTIFVDEVDPVFERATAAGAVVQEAPWVTMYGERQCHLRDPSGRSWMFSSHAKDVDPADWASVTTPLES